jgi:hypothetical protein
VENQRIGEQQFEAVSLCRFSTSLFQQRDAGQASDTLFADCLNYQKCRTVTRSWSHFMEVCEVDSNVSRRFSTFRAGNGRTFTAFTSKLW